MDRRVRESLKMLLTTIVVPTIIIAIFISLLNSVMGTGSPLAVVEIDMSPWYVSSMYPTLFPGDLLILSGKEDLQMGDVVVYRNPYSNKNIVHRIVGTKTDQYGEIRYVTKGDYNAYPDFYNPSNEDVVGKWVGIKIHLVGFVLLMANTTLGRILLISILVFLLITELLGIVREGRKKAPLENEVVSTTC